MKIKISKVDKLFSDIVRARANWTCERCGRRHDPTDPHSRMGLHCSHYWGRGHKATRFDFSNVSALCFGCHLHFHANPKEHMEWFEGRIGQDKADALRLKAHKPTKIDINEIRQSLKEELKKLEAQKAKEENPF